MLPRTWAIDRPLGTALNRALRRVAGPVVRSRTGFWAFGTEHVPAKGAASIAANHAAFTDTVWVGLALRRPLIVAGAKPRLFERRRTRAVMALGNVLRVDDRESYLEDTLGFLAAGRCLLTYPAFGRHPEGLGPFRPWVAELSILSKTPIVPCFIHGTTDGHTGPPWVRFGASLTGDDPEELTSTLRSAIQELG